MYGMHQWVCYPSQGGRYGKINQFPPKRKYDQKMGGFKGDICPDSVGGILK